MSHTATVKVAFSDTQILKDVCERLGLTYQEGQQKVRLYSETVDCEFSINLSGWNYPIAITGDKVLFDNYNGRWGRMEELEKLQDQYSRETILQVARMRGFTCDEEVDPLTGDIVLTVYDYSS